MVSSLSPRTSAQPHGTHLLASDYPQGRLLDLDYPLARLRQAEAEAALVSASNLTSGRSLDIEHLRALVSGGGHSDILHSVFFH